MKANGDNAQRSPCLRIAVYFTRLCERLGERASIVGVLDSRPNDEKNTPCICLAFFLSNIINDAEGQQEGELINLYTCATYLFIEKGMFDDRLF